jgi:hypothetical protein
MSAFSGRCVLFNRQLPLLWAIIITWRPQILGRWSEQGHVKEIACFARESNRTTRKVRQTAWSASRGASAATCQRAFGCRLWLPRSTSQGPRHPSLHSLDDHQKQTQAGLPQSVHREPHPHQFGHSTIRSSGSRTLSKRTDRSVMCGENRQHHEGTSIYCTRVQEGCPRLHRRRSFELFGRSQRNSHLNCLRTR